MNEKDCSKEGIKVVDKRRFDAEGHERTGDDCGDSCGCAGPEEKKEGESGSGKANGRSQESSRQEAPPLKIDFSSFIMSLATQAMMALGDVEPPEGMDVKVDKQAARQMIDILEMLKEKTANNLEKEEDRFLEEILHNLRLRYVAAK